MMEEYYYHEKIALLILFGDRVLGFVQLVNSQFSKVCKALLRAAFVNHLWVTDP